MNFDDHSFWFNFSRWAAICGSLVIFLSGIGLWHFGRLIARNTQMAIAQSQEEAAKANVEAARANKETATINLKLEETKNQAGQTKLELEQTALNVKEQEKKVKELQIELEKEKAKNIQATTELIKLKEKVGWRQLNEKAFIHELEKSDKSKIQIIYNADDAEAYQFASIIRAALLKAVWEVESFESADRSGPWPFSAEVGGAISSANPGLNILISEDEFYKESENSASKSLKRAFESSKITPMIVGGYEEIRPAKGYIKIIVDSRL